MKTHWRGQQGLLWSFLVNGVAGYAVMIAAALRLGVAFGNSHQWLIAVVLLVIFVWFAWALVGIARAGLRILKDPGTSSWLKLTAVVIFPCLAAGLFAITSDVTIVGRWLLGFLRG